MKNYLELAEKIIKEGEFKKDRTNTGTYSIFGTQTRYNLKDGFPLITTKKVFFKSIVFELLWFIKGDTNIKYLVDNGVNIWNEWPFIKFKNSNDYDGESIEDFIKKIKENKIFAEKHGDLGPIYGKQWRNFGGVDQIKNIMDLLKNNSDSRRIIVSAWNPQEINEMLLPPCHSFFQFYLNNNKLSCQLYQRSADYFLGVPFNIASYSLFVLMICHVLKLEPNEFIHTIGDCHIYDNHLDLIKEQIKRVPFKKPFVSFSREINSIFDFKYEDFVLENYNFHPSIKGKVAV